MPVAELNYRKKQAVQELNGFIGLKKAYGAQAAARGELLAAGSSAAGGMTPEQMHGARCSLCLPLRPPTAALAHPLSCRRALESDLKTLEDSPPLPPHLSAATPTADLMEAGRRQIGETDASLVRAERLVNDTVAIGAQTAETLQLQGKQLEKVADDLDEIHFTMRKARQVLRDMARGLATDKCILFFLALIVVGVVVVVVLKATGVGGGGGDAASPSPSPPQAPAQG